MCLLFICWVLNHRKAAVIMIGVFGTFTSETQPTDANIQKYLSHLHEEAVGVEPRQEDVLQDVTDTLLLEPESLGSHN